MKDELKELRRQLAIGQVKEAKELQELHRMHEEDVPALIHKETNTFLSANSQRITTLPSSCRPLLLC